MTSAAAATTAHRQNSIALCGNTLSHVTHVSRLCVTPSLQADVDTWVAPKSHGASTSGKKRSQRPGEEPSAGQDTPASGSAEPAEGACHPVMCEVCETQVGVVDPVEGMFILYNIVPSEA